MPKLTEKLTDAVLRKLPVPEKGNVLWYDPDLKGFAGRVTSNGARAYVGAYRFGGRERRDVIGELGIWKDKAAREVFKGWRRDARLGIDPRGEPEPEEPDGATFKARAEAFLEHGRRKRGLPLRPATRREYRRALMVYAAVLHGRPLAEIRRGEVATVIQRVAGERGEVTAMRTRAALSRLFSWAIANGHAEVNPVTGTEGFATPKRSRVLTDAELAALWAATAEPSDFNLIVRLCLWTGCRRAEAGGMAWSELDGGVWTVPGSRTKNGRPLALPQPRQALEALESWPRIVGKDTLFGRGPNGFQGWSQSKRRLDSRLGFNADWDLHDIRRSVQTRLAGLEAYNRHAYTEEKRHALQRWADALERIVGEARPNVLPLRRSGS
jgi:integrase